MPSLRDSLDMSTARPRKIIHIDMDCFYAAVEMRDNPALQGKAIAVGGLSTRSVICSANYEARKLGVRAAMSNNHAYRLCPELIMVPVNMAKYKVVSQNIMSILRSYTSLVEPLALDEAYLDVSNCLQYQGSATFIAQAIRRKIFQEHGITASAGIAPNKFLAKIASGWNKPNGQFVITPTKVANFIAKLPIEEIWGVGKKTTKKLHAVGLKTCHDLQKHSETYLVQHFGRLGHHLYHFCRGNDTRAVNPDRIAKSVSAENTFLNDLHTLPECLQQLPEIFVRLQNRLERHLDRTLKAQFIKLKFHDFTVTTLERRSHKLDLPLFEKMCQQAYERHQKPVRLIGMGVDFIEPEKTHLQLELILTNS